MQNSSKLCHSTPVSMQWLVEHSAGYTVILDVLYIFNTAKDDGNIYTSEIESEAIKESNSK